MTGYGKAEGLVGSKKITVEIRSLNSKFLDCNLRIPGLYREKEMVIRSLVAKEANRGKVDVTISYDALESEQNYFVNKSLIKSYYESLSELSGEIDLANVDKTDFLGTLMRLPDVMRSEKPKLTEEEWNGIEALLVGALEKFNQFRVEEGGVLSEELTNRVTSISRLLEDVLQYEDSRIETVKARIRKNLEEVVEKDSIDNNRFEQELIYYLEKYDITEEKIRLKAHCDHFIKTVDEENGQGKKLGFISQEIGREINTLGSKANHADMQRIVVQMKDELEKIKEQTLNVL